MKNITTSEEIVRLISEEIENWDGRDLAELASKVLPEHYVVYQEDGYFEVRNDPLAHGALPEDDDEPE